MLDRFEKKNLRAGMLVEIKSGALLLVVITDWEGSSFLLDEDNWLSLDSYNNDLTIRRRYDSDTKDIVKVYSADRGTLNDMKVSKKLIWDRDYKRELTLDEIEEKLGYKVTIVSHASQKKTLLEERESTPSF